MKNLLLQHWMGPMETLQRKSFESIRNYAASLDADYRLLKGRVFRKDLLPQCQKVHMLSEEFDGYDIVVMVDSDSFAVKGMKDNVFEAKGIGRYHRTAHKRVLRHFPDISGRYNAFWGGAVYRTTLDERRLLRSFLPKCEVERFNSGIGGWDEGIMHRLAVLAGIRDWPKYYMDDDKWCYSSFLPEPETAGIIHVRTKVLGGGKRPKIENYKELHRRGII